MSKPSPARVAGRFLTGGAIEVAESTQKSVAAVGNWVTELQQHAALMDRLIDAGEKRRLGRTTDIAVKSVRWTGTAIVAEIAGTTGDYDTRITLTPRPGHRCTCPDWAQNGIRVGPCKHVLRLGQYWRDERIAPALDRVEDHLIGILEKAEF